MQPDHSPESQLLKICQRGNFKQAKKWMVEHPDCNINCTNEQGQTPLLLLTTCNYSSTTIRYFLDHGADKSIKDKKGNSFFSQVQQYCNEHSYYNINIMDLYTLEEINSECKNMPEPRKYTAKTEKNNIRAIIQAKLNGHSDINESIPSLHHKSALCIACSYSNIPLIVSLLKKGARQDPYPYYMLPYRLHWVVREAFNNGSFIRNAALISETLCTLSTCLVPDIAQLIRKTYIQCIDTEQLLSTPEAYLWSLIYILHKKPIEHKTQWILRMLALPQKEKTEINIEIASEQWHDFS